MSEDTTQTTIAQGEQQAGTAQGLQLTDLILALQVIQASASRGAVRADEMSTVGSLHDRLFAFLEAQGAITRNAPSAASQDNTSGVQSA